jgi:hypothetical protein
MSDEAAVFRIMHGGQLESRKEKVESGKDRDQPG